MASTTSPLLPSAPAPASMGIRLSWEEDLVELQRRLEAWLLIARFIRAGRTSSPV
jgi:hypothetical protein